MKLYYTKKEFEVLSNVNNVNIVLSAKVYLDKKLKKECGTITFNSTIINNYGDNNNIQFFTQVSVILYNGIKFSFNYIRINLNDVTSKPTYSNIKIKKITRVIMKSNPLLRKLIIKQ